MFYNLGAAVVSGISLCLVNQGSQVRNPTSPSRGPVFWGALKSQPLPVEPSPGAPGHKQTPNHKPTGPVLVIANEHGH